jgi:hypothetical protein
MFVAGPVCDQMVYAFDEGGELNVRLHELSAVSDGPTGRLPFFVGFGETVLDRVAHGRRVFVRELIGTARPVARARERQPDRRAARTTTWKSPRIGWCR